MLTYILLTHIYAEQEDVMVFVNTIADIVHRAVKENEGAPNKNIGEAFLVVWRLKGVDMFYMTCYYV